MIRRIRSLLDRGWTMGVAAVVLLVAAVGATSVVASAADTPMPPSPPLPTPAERIPASETPFGLQSWPHGTCVDSREVEAYSLGCNSGRNQDYLMHQQSYSAMVPNGSLEPVFPNDPSAFQLVDLATGWCLDNKGGAEVVTSQCSDSSVTQAWTLDVGHRDWDGRAVLRFLNRGTNLWLALGHPNGELDVYATGDAATFDRDFAINW